MGHGPDLRLRMGVAIAPGAEDCVIHPALNQVLRDGTPHGSGVRAD